MTKPIDEILAPKPEARPRIIEGRHARGSGVTPYEYCLDFWFCENRKYLTCDWYLPASATEAVYSLYRTWQEYMDCLKKNATDKE